MRLLCSAIQTSRNQEPPPVTLRLFEASVDASKKGTTESEASGRHWETPSQNIVGATAMDPCMHGVRDIAAAWQRSPVLRQEQEEHEQG